MRLLWERTRRAALLQSEKDQGAAAFCRELIWREFACQLLHFYPQTVEEPLNAKFRSFLWKNEAGILRSWQWVAGCGADAAPFFRVFNPVRQGEKFDVQGDYVRRWVPELRRLPAKWIHCPWAAPVEVLERACVKLGGNYPEPIVDHAEARDGALELFELL